MGYKFNPFTGNLDVVDTTAAAGSTTEVQFNNSGVLDGSADLTWDDTGKVLGVGGDIDLDDGGTYTTTLQTITPTAARTISFPDATGTVGLVGGSSGNLVVNQSGAYAGVANSSVDNATGNITLGSRFISSLNGAASAPPGTFTGTWFTGGTGTTTKPQVLIEPTGATSTAWSTSGTGLGINAASGFAGRLLDLQTNGTSQMIVTGAGQLLVGTSSSVSANCYLQLLGNPANNAGTELYLGRREAATNPITAGQSIGDIRFGDNAGNLFARITASADWTSGSGDYPGRLVFSTTADGAATPTERMRITSDAYVRLAAGTGGIQFNGDTAAANALDDYEEGTWTPALSASGATFGYTVNNGRYTKIGNSVTVHGRIILFSASGGSGTVTLTGLPFAGAPAIGGNNVGQQGIIGRTANFAGDVPDSLEAKEGATEANIYYRASANAATSLLDYSDLGSTANFLFTLTYRTTN